jgi:hypothetical protein
MAKGTLHLNVEFSAVTDEEGKFARLATLLGLADADHARGKCEHLWVACTRRGESELPQWLVEQILGERGPDALVQAELAAWAGGRGDSTTRRMRIGGAEKHCMWLSKQPPNTEQSSKGGKTRASTASRWAGRFVAHHQADHQAVTSPSEISSEILPEIPPGRAIPPSPQYVPPEAPEAPEQIPERETRPDLATRQATKTALMAELGEARQRVAVKLGAVAYPLLAFDPGERDLADRIALLTSADELATFTAQARHAITMAELETASGEKSLEWLTGAIFADRNLRRLAGKTLADAARARAGPRGSPPTAARAIRPKHDTDAPPLRTFKP